MSLLRKYDGGVRREHSQCSRDSSYVGVWHFTDSNPNVARDSTVYGNNGTGSGVTAGTVAGRIAKTFTSTGANVLIGASSSLAVGNTMTLDLWMQPIGSRLYNANETLVTESGTLGFALMFDPAYKSVPNAGGVAMGIPSWAAIADTGGGPIGTNNWQHIVYTRNGAGAGTSVMYLNGVPQPLVTTSSTV